MKSMIIKSVLIAAMFFTSQVLYSQVGLKKVAQSTMNFQLVGLSAKASSMGDAFCAIGKGAESIFFNPAGAAETQTRFDVKMYATQWIADINYMAGSMTWNLGTFGSLGLSALTVDYGTIYSTSLISEAEISLYPLGYKDNGAVNNLGAYSFGLTYARAISSQFFIGGNIRYVGQNLGQSTLESGVTDNHAAKLVFDAGVKYYTGLKSFRFGMAIRNFSSNIKREEIEEQLPVLFTMGMALDLLDFITPDHSPDHTMTLAVDFLHLNNYSERVNVGLDYTLLGKISIRGGYQSNQDLASWSGGIGLNTQMGKNSVQFDYSYSVFDLFDGVSRFSMGISF